jgi:acyl-ACP thioesterase
MTRGVIISAAACRAAAGRATLARGAKMPDKLEAGWTPGFADYDPDGAVRASSLFREMQEAAGYHADLLGVGWGALRAANRVWLLSRFSLRLSRSPAWRAETTLATWPRGAERLFFLRDYEMRDAGGCFAFARAWWVLWDFVARKPVKPDGSGIALPDNSSEEEPMRAFPPYPRDGREAHALSLEARRSDMDRNGHVNNARYVEWAFDALSRAGSPLATGWGSFAIQYSAEAAEGDHIALAVGDAGTVTATRPSDGERVFTAIVGP